jgi:putative transposase
MYLRATTSYGSLIPGSEYIRDLIRQGTISPEAAKKLRWMDHYVKHRNARLTCRYFGISLKTFYRWWNRFDPYDLTTLEEESRRPLHVRQPQLKARGVLVEPVNVTQAKLARKRRRKPRYAIRKPKDYRPAAARRSGRSRYPPGQARAQRDPLSVLGPGRGEPVRRHPGL